MITAFREGGAMMYGVLCCGGLGHVFALLALGFMFSKKRGAVIGLGAASVGAGIFAMAVGFLGYYLGMSMTESAASFADPAQRAMLVAQGRAESMNNIWFGSFACGCPSLAGVIALVKGLLTKPPPGVAEAPVGRG